MQQKKGYRGFFLPIYTPDGGKSQWAMPRIIQDPLQAITRLTAPLYGIGPARSTAEMSRDAFVAVSLFGGAGFAAKYPRQITRSEERRVGKEC